MVAEAAMQYVNRNNQVIGLIAMDVPYIGMFSHFGSAQYARRREPRLGVHPHVIVSGIVSLFPSSKKDGLEQDLNDTDKVHMVSQSAIESANTPQSLSPAVSPPRATSPVAPSTRLSVSSITSNTSGKSSNLQLPDLTPGPSAWQNTCEKL